MRLLLLAPFAAAFALAGCVHTPPGTSVEIALAKKATLVRMPLPTQVTVGQMGAASKSSSRLSRVEALLSSEWGMRIRGGCCLQAGQDAEAIEAFQEVVKLDPSFTDAWQNLALLYEKTGQEKKAIEAFKKAKKIARQ